MHREAGTFPFFSGGLSAPAVGDGRFGAETFLSASGAVGRALTMTCAAVMLVCSFGCDGIKRARAAAEVFSVSAPPLGFGAFGGARRRRQR
jgi:hypothetical protein